MGQHGFVVEGTHQAVATEHRHELHLGVVGGSEAEPPCWEQLGPRAALQVVFLAATVAVWRHHRAGRTTIDATGATGAADEQSLASARRP